MRKNSTPQTPRFKADSRRMARFGRSIQHTLQISPPDYDYRLCKQAGGGPAATYLSCFAKKGKPKKATARRSPSGSRRQPG